MRLKEEILEIVREFTDGVPDDTSVNLLDIGIIDSMAVMNILTSAEEEFGFEVEAKDISRKNFESVDKIAEMVEKYLK